MTYLQVSLDKLGVTDGRKALELHIIEVALEQKTPVEIYHNDESGEFKWAVQLINTDFWVDCFLTKDEAINFCEDEDLSFTVN